jgi:hypothetical protein
LERNEFSARKARQRFGVLLPHSKLAMPLFSSILDVTNLLRA